MERKCQFRTMILEVFKYNHSVWNSEENPKGVCGKLPDEIQKMAGWLFLLSLSPMFSFSDMRHQTFPYTLLSLFESSVIKDKI